MNPHLRWLVVCLALAVPLGRAYPQQPMNPVVGILSEPVTYGECVSAIHLRQVLGPDVASSSGSGPTLPPMPNGSGCVWSVYVDWLQASGVRVVPIPWDASEERMSYLLDRVNGVVFAGGILGWIPSLRDSFFRVAKRIYDEVVRRNRRGDRLVLWGTCQGFEMVNAAAAGSFSVVKSGYVGMNPLMLNVSFTPAASDSRIFGSAPPEILDYMRNEASTLNWHMLGVPPAEFVSDAVLNASGLQPLSTSTDPAGRVFVSSVESAVAEVYAVQFHPERVMFEFDNSAIGHTRHDIEIAEYLSLFLMSRLRLNNHSFEDPVEVNAMVIENYPRFNLGWGIRIFNV